MKKLNFIRRIIHLILIMVTITSCGLGESSFVELENAHVDQSTRMNSDLTMLTRGNYSKKIKHIACMNFIRASKIRIEINAIRKRKSLVKNKDSIPLMNNLLQKNFKKYSLYYNLNKSLLKEKPLKNKVWRYY